MHGRGPGKGGIEGCDNGHNPSTLQIHAGDSAMTPMKKWHLFPLPHESGGGLKTTLWLSQCSRSNAVPGSSLNLKRPHSSLLSFSPYPPHPSPPSLPAQTAGLQNCGLNK